MGPPIVKGLILQCFDFMRMVNELIRAKVMLTAVSDAQLRTVVLTQARYYSS